MRLYPTIITPFFEDKSIDFNGLANLIRHFAMNGCDGIFAVCQSSEMAFLSDEEKLELAAFSIAQCRRYGLDCVVSGHTQDTMEAQIQYLQRLEKLKPDAIVLVTNRFAAEDEPESLAIENLRKLMAALSPETRLGVYECPMPYKRLLSDEILKVMAESGRFDFIKDTCCQIDLIRHRLDLLRGTGVALYNANAKTLYESLVAGAAGYSGILLNFMPEFYHGLKDTLAENPVSWARAYEFCRYISTISVIEYQNYPTNVKYLLKQRGIIEGTSCRIEKPAMTESQRGETTDLFLQSERALYDCAKHAEIERIFRAGQFFPSCHASTVLPLADGSVLCAYFAGLREHSDDMAIYLSRFHDGGWDKPTAVACVGKTPHWNPVLFEVPGGVRLVFKSGSEISDWENWTMFSADGGLTWTEPVKVAPDPSCGPVRSRPIQLKDGRYLAPNSDQKGKNKENWSVRVDISEDGVNFAKYADIPLNRTDATQESTYLPGHGAIQPTLWRGGDGALHAMMRTDVGAIYRSDSTDEGKTWCVAYRTNLPNNNSGIDIVRAEGKLYLAMNPNTSDSRTPLVILRSENEGESFSLWRVLCDLRIDEESGKPAEFSYPSLAYRDGKLYATFTDQRRSIAYACMDL